jgi:hypothetical protein
MEVGLEIHSPLGHSMIEDGMKNENGMGTNYISI